MPELDDMSPCAAGCCLCAIVVGIPYGIVACLILFGSPIMPNIIFDVSVENATLHTMDMDYSNHTLTYSLSAVFSFRNTYFSYSSWPSSSKVAAVLLYGGQQLGPESSQPTFEVRYLETTVLPLDVRGQQAAGAVVARRYADDAAQRCYGKLSMRFGGPEWCDSSCNFYFIAPSSSPTGGRRIFDGDDCRTKCNDGLLHDTEEVMYST